MPKFQGIVTRTGSYTLTIEAKDYYEADEIARNMSKEELAKHSVLRYDEWEAFPDEFPEEV